MTKVQLHYKLTRTLNDADMEQISKIHGFYGIVRVTVEPSLDAIAVEYDASRLLQREVEATLARFGVPVERKDTIVV
jgi:copper chaperone CopZ